MGTNKLNIFMLQPPIYYVLEWEISIGMRAMRKKIEIFMLHLTIYCISEWEISRGANVDIAKMKTDK